MRLYATLKNTAELLALYRGRDLDGLTRFTVTLLRAIPDRSSGYGQQPAAPRAEQIQAAASQLLADVRAVSAPSLDWRVAFVDDTDQYAHGVAPDILPDELIIAYELPNAEHVRLFLDLVNGHRNVPLDAAGNAFLAAGLDPGGSVADHWCPGVAKFAMFGHREHARRTIRASALTSNAFLGQRVNVAIIDEGLDKAQIPPKNWGGGLDHFIDTGLDQPAGAAPRTSHGMMIARSILDLAPDARLYDVPAVPLNPIPVPVAVSSMQAAYDNLIHVILQRRTLPQWSGPWVLVNAWGIFDTSTDPSGSYTRNLEPHGHPLINLVTRAVQVHHLDIVFAAGNCGQFCPSQRCGDLDRGPGHSIWGANAHPLVITVGAVRSDETWVGYSSQGPGPETLSIEKPDLCAPSQFCETYDAASLSSGTSASCAITAGVVAALRSNPVWDQVTVTPEALRLALISSARKPLGPVGWDDRMGFGILDAAATIDTLSV
ncbi:MAG: S8/S53 family peptidase [Acetobacteraceae bacterium]|jgi:subtilisin family serine protease